MPIGRIVIEPATIHKNYDPIAVQVQAWKALGKKVVVTIGSWDMLHIGHVRYLIEASKRGDCLIVGVDSDATVKKYKGEKRPIVPQDERMEMLSYIWCVNIVTLIDDTDEKGKWQYGLLRTLHPDVFVAVEDSYPEDQRRDIRLLAKELVVLPRQAENTSSTDIVQRVIKAEMLPQIEAHRHRKPPKSHPKRKVS